MSASSSSLLLSSNTEDEKQQQLLDGKEDKEGKDDGDDSDSEEEVTLEELQRRQSNSSSSKKGSEEGIIAIDELLKRVIARKANNAAKEGTSSTEAAASLGEEKKLNTKEAFGGKKDKVVGTASAVVAAAAARGEEKDSQEGRKERNGSNTTTKKKKSAESASAAGQKHISSSGGNNNDVGANASSSAKAAEAEGAEGTETSEQAVKRAVCAANTSCAGNGKKYRYVEFIDLDEDDDELSEEEEDDEEEEEDEPPRKRGASSAKEVVNNAEKMGGGEDKMARVAKDIKDQSEEYAERGTDASPASSTVNAPKNGKAVVHNQSGEGDMKDGDGEGQMKRPPSKPKSPLATSTSTPNDASAAEVEKQAEKENEMDIDDEKEGNAMAATLKQQLSKDAAKKASRDDKMEVEVIELDDDDDDTSDDGDNSDNDESSTTNSTNTNEDGPVGNDSKKSNDEDDVSSSCSSSASADSTTTNNTPKYDGEGGLLPKDDTSRLFCKIRELAEEFALEAQKKGKDFYYWNILSKDKITDIAEEVPTTLPELSNCGLSDPTIREYGVRIAACVSRFVYDNKLEKYLLAKGFDDDAVVVAKKDTGDNKATATTATERSGGDNKGPFAKTTLPSKEKADMVLPESFAKKLLERMMKLVQTWAQEEQRNGKDIFYWHIMNNMTMMAIAQKVPTKPTALFDCGLSDQSMRQYGLRIIRNIKAFIREEKLEKYLSHKNIDDIIEIENGNHAAAATGGDDKMDGMVLPKEYTSMIWARLHDWSTKVQWNYNNISGVLSNYAIGIIANGIPTSMEELSECGVSTNTIKQYGEQIIRIIVDFITREKLEQYLLNKIKGKAVNASDGGNQKQQGSTSLGNNATAETTAARMARASAINMTGLSKTNPATAAPTVHQSNASNGPLQFVPLMRPNQTNTSTKVSRTNVNVLNTTGTGTSLGRNDCQVTTGASMASNKQNQTIEATLNNNMPPARERFSEYRIDNPNLSTDDLEWIRSRLQSLVGRVDERLKEKRLVEAFTQVSSANENKLADLTIEELMDKLSKDDDKSDESDSDDAGAKGSSKRSLEDAEIYSSDDNKRQRLSTICSLCFDTATSSSSFKTCEICEESSICAKCHKLCNSCQRSTCVDCLVCCKGCGFRYHCTDCMMLGGGKCVFCRPKKARAKPSQQQKGQPQPLPVHRGHAVRNHSQTGMVNALSSSNAIIGHPHPQFYPQRNPPPLPSLPRGFDNPSNTLAHELSKLYSYPPQHVTNQAQRAALTAQSTVMNQTTQQLYSIHRFIISDSGVIGVNITLQTKTQTCIISSMRPNSAAIKHGVQINDEILRPHPTIGSSSVYDLFLDASKHRPIIFECKRLYRPPSETLPYQLRTPHSLHRFVITEAGPLGVSLCKQDEFMSSIASIAPNSLSEIHGLRKNDIICEPFTNGLKLADFNNFVTLAKSGTRPFTIEVWREVPSLSLPRQNLPGSGSGNKNPFIFSFPSRNPSLQNNTRENKGPVETASEKKMDISGTATSTKSSTLGNRGNEIVLLDDEDDDDVDDSANHSKVWMCDFCKTQFTSYEETFEHELVCHKNDGASEEKKRDSD